MTFGERLYQLRKEKNLSQEDLADQLHVSRQSISRWENGSASPDFEKASQLSQLFGVTLDYLINGATVKEEPSKTKQKLPTWRIIVGALLLSIGGIHLLGGLLGGYYFEYYLLTVLPLLACGFLVLLTKKYTSLFCLWVVYWCLTNFLYISFSWHWSQVFLTFTTPLKQFEGTFLLDGSCSFCYSPFSSFRLGSFGNALLKTLKNTCCSPAYFLPPLFWLPSFLIFGQKRF